MNEAVHFLHNLVPQPLKREKTGWRRTISSPITIPKQHQTLRSHVTEIAKMLHANALEQGTNPTTCGEIGQTVGCQILNHVPLASGFFSLLA